ncbi:MAG: hypothetical protein IPK09_00005 [Candidatus Competibacteraceae bacterium]|nr:hypothetical protein [Candidatus Competibacteraceae bacterium]
MHGRSSKLLAGKRTGGDVARKALFRAVALLGSLLLVVSRRRPTLSSLPVNPFKAR